MVKFWCFEVKRCGSLARVSEVVCGLFCVCMRICCFPFLCFGENEEDSITTVRGNFCYFYCRNKEGNHMRESLLGNEIGEMDNDDSELGFWANFYNGAVGGGVRGLGLVLGGERANEREANEREANQRYVLDGEINQEIEDFLVWHNNVRTRRADGASGSQEMNLEVNLNLGLGGEPSSSTSMIATGRDSSDGDSQKKRPKVHSFSL